MKPPTFYYWIKKLRIERSTEQNEKSEISIRKPMSQVVVPINVIEEPYVGTQRDMESDTAIVVEVNSITLKIHNHANPSLIQHPVQALRYLC